MVGIHDIPASSQATKDFCFILFDNILFYLAHNMENDTEGGRVKRQKLDKTGRFAAFQKLKEHTQKGSKNKYQVNAIDNIYEIVDEKEYTKKVLSRQDEDWIVDDDGSGYIEDGRDIFDDDLDSMSIATASKNKGKSANKNKAVSESAGRGNLQFMLSNMPSKKKEISNLSEDDILLELIQEIDEDQPKTTEKTNEVKLESEDGIKLKTLEVKDSKTLELNNSVIEKQENVKEVGKSWEEEINIIVDDDTFDDFDTMKLPNAFDDFGTMELPSNASDDGRKTFRFFWWDCFEDRRTQPGVVFLFGKTYCEATKTYDSCCVAVRNILRKIFLLPRPTFKSNPTKPVSLLDVYHEFNNNLKLDTFKSKKTTKNYPFDSKIPLQSEYLEVRYAAKSPQVPPEHYSGETYSKIFGLNTSYLEIILLEQKIKGPCWLEVIEPEVVSNKVSWCKHEINCNKSSNLQVQIFEKTVPSPPPLTVAAINMRTIVSHHANSSAKNEIVMISCLIHKRYLVDRQAPNPPFQQHFCVIARPDGKILPMGLHDSLQKYTGTRVQKMDGEKALLTYFISQFNNLDPDLVVGHDMQGYQLDLLCHRLRQLKIHHFSKFGRLKRTEIPHRGKFEREVFCGRLVCDIKTSAKELIRARSYDLDTLCQTVLKLKDGVRLSLEPEEIPRMYQSSNELLKLISLTMQDTAFILKMMYDLNVIPLALQITNIAGNVMSRTLLGGRSERNEFLLLHAFTEKDYLVPDKELGKKTKDGNGEVTNSSQRKKPTYTGGLVLDPKVGFYEKFILLMDFNSLYPSIIQEYNVCFTTLTHNSNGSPNFSSGAGILPTEIKKLVQSRYEVKKLMKNSEISRDSYTQYNIRQMALKLTANSMYGCLGFSNSRFFAKELAAFITQRGREILTNTKDAVEKMSFEVIYGDTDSIMINTNCLDYDQVLKVGNKIKQEINKSYKQIELDIDGVFKYLLLLKKKKYAAVTLSKTKNGELKVAQEHKGLDIVRRDWSQLSSEAGKIILNHILSDLSIEEKMTNIEKHLTKLKQDLTSNVTPLQLLVITKQLTKNPKEYSEKNALTHVRVALRYNAKGGKQLKNGDTVHYIICEDGTTNAATQRGYHVEEFKNSTHLKLDVKYYLSQQIHPVISRLCEPIPGLDTYQIANWLGLDLTNYKKQTKKIENDIVQFSNTIRYKNCEAFTFKCYFCKYFNKITDLFMDNQPFLNKCMNTECHMRPVDYLQNVQNQLNIAMKKYIKKFYSFQMTCEDPTCINDTSYVTTKTAGKYTACPSCQQSVMYMKYSAKDLHVQLTYFQNLVDLRKHDKRRLVNSSLEIGYSFLKQCVDKILLHSDFNIIHLSEMLTPFVLKTTNNGTEIKDQDYEEDIYDPEENEDAV